MPNACILVVEDELIVARDLQHRLIRHGYTVPALASSGEEAIHQAEVVQPDLILMDIKLQGAMDGIEAAVRIKNRREIPIIFLTAFSDDVILEKAKITDPSGYVLKPFEDREVLIAIEMALFKYRTSRELQEKDRWLATTLRSIGDAVIATDSEDRIKFINDVARTLTGWNEDDALGRPLSEVFRTTSSAEMLTTRALFGDAPPSAEPLAETLLETRTGAHIPIAHTQAPIQNQDHSLLGRVLVFHDITETLRSAAEQEAELELLQILHRAESRTDLAIKSTRFFTRLIGGSGGKILIHDKRPQTCSCPLAVMEYPSSPSTGSEHDLSKPICAHHQACDRLLQPIIQAILGGTTDPDQPEFTSHGSFLTTTRADLHAVYRRLANMESPDVDNNDKRCHSIALIPIRSGDEIVATLQLCHRREGIFPGRMIHFIERLTRKVGMSFARWNAEEERTRLATAIEQTAEGIIITDDSGYIQYINPACQTITGYSANELLTRAPNLFASPECFGRFPKEIRSHIHLDGRWSGHCTIRHAAGPILELEYSMSPVRDRTGQISHIVVLQRDVTDKVRMEKMIRQAQKMEAIGSLAGGIAHDFNNILSAVIGFAELAQFEIENPEQVKSHLVEVMHAGNLAKNLIKQILTFSRQEEQEKKPVSLIPVIKQVHRLLRASLPSTIEIRNLIRVKSGTIMADPVQIHQVLMNLGTNAAHAMPAGGILELALEEISVADDDGLLATKMPPGSYIRLSVSDTGHGIPPTIIDRIFDPFFTTKKPSEGTGMGLAVVHGIVKSHEGTITVDSRLEQGTTFRVYFPKVQDRSIPAQARLEDLKTGQERILFVDDEKPLIFVGEKMLRRLGYDVTTRTSSVEALECFRTQPERFDLVITDQTMPQMTGEEMARQMKQIRPDIPVILCTGFSESFSPERAQAANIRACLMKPVVMKELGQTLRDIFDAPSDTPIWVETN